MPNWCDTTYKVVGEPKEVGHLFRSLQKLESMKSSYMSNGFGNMWLGCVINYLGGNYENYSCRGEILDFQMRDDILVISQETAWCEQEGFREFLEQKYPSIKVYYCEEEPGCDVYYTNDTTGLYFPERYVLDGYDGTDYFKTLDEVIVRVRDITGNSIIKTEDDVLLALDLFNEQHEDDEEDCFYYLHKFEVGDS